jgi:hypothetical protein
MRFDRSTTDLLKQGVGEVLKLMAEIQVKQAAICPLRN